MNWQQFKTDYVFTDDQTMACESHRKATQRQMAFVAGAGLVQLAALLWLMA